MQDRKRFAINMIAQIIAFFVNFGISFILTPYIVKSIGKEAYGFIGLANNFVSYAQLITIALNSMAARYITIHISRNEIELANKYYSSIFFANLFIAIFLVIISAIALFNLKKLIDIPTNISNDVILLFLLVFLNFIINLTTSLYSIATFATNRLDLASIRTIFSNLIRVTILFLCFYFFKPNVWFIGLASLFTTLYLVFTNIRLTKKLLPNLELKSKFFDLFKIKELIHSGIWNTLSKLSLILSVGLDLLIANIFINSSAMGTLSLAKIIPSLILSIFATLAGVYAPDLTIAYAQNRYEEIKNQLLSSMKFLGFLASIPLSILFAYGDMFFHLWVPGENALLIQILSILSCFELCFALPQEGLWNIFTVANKVKVASLNLLLMSILIITSVFIAMHTVDINHRIYFLGGITSFYGTVRLLTFLPIYGARCLKLKWNTFYPALFKTIISIIILTAFSILLRRITYSVTWYSLILDSLLTILLGMTINFYLILNHDERNILINRTKKISKLCLNKF